MLATVIFALPPAIRLTSLGIRQVPEDSLEAGLAFGVTKRQLLRKVQLPLAKPAIMVGVNQTIMMALGIIVIAATVGLPRSRAEGPGRRSKRLHVGQALAAGLALVAMAIVLDRVTFGWSEAERERRGSTSVHIFGWTISRRALLVVLGVVVVLAVIVGRQVLRQQDFPDTYVVSIAPPVDRVDESVIRLDRALHAEPFRRHDDQGPHAVDEPPDRDAVVDGVPRCRGRAPTRPRGAWTLALMAFVCIAVIGFVGQWDNAMDTLPR